MCIRDRPGSTLLLPLRRGAPGSALLRRALRGDALRSRLRGNALLRHTLLRHSLLRHALLGRALLRLLLALGGLCALRGGIGGRLDGSGGLGGPSSALGGGVRRCALRLRRRGGGCGLRRHGGRRLGLGCAHRLRFRVIVVVPERGRRVDTRARATIARACTVVRGRRGLRGRLRRGSCGSRRVGAGVLRTQRREARRCGLYGRRGRRRTLLRNAGSTLGGAGQRSAERRRRIGGWSGGRRRRRSRGGGSARAPTTGVVARVPGRCGEIDLELTGQVELGLVVVRIVSVRTESLLLVHCASWCTATHLNGRTGYRRIDRM